MAIRNGMLIAGVALAVTTGWSGCGGGEKGPAEQVGKQIDQAAEGAANAAGDAAQAAGQAATDGAAAVEKKLE